MSDHTHVVLDSDLSSEMHVSFGMPHCKDCRFWEQAVYLPPSIDPRPGYGECAKARSRGSVEDGALAFAYESNYWSADLITAANFGCVQFQPRPASEVKSDA